MAIRTADKNFPYYIMKSTTCVVQLRESHVDKWGGSEFSPGDQVLNGCYYEQEGNDFLHQRLVKKYQSNTVPAKTVIYFCSEMAATDTYIDGGFTTQTHFEMHLITILIESDFFRLAI